MATRSWMLFVDGENFTIRAQLTGRIFRHLFGAWLLVGLGATAVVAQERVDLFDTQGRRTGYAIVDREQGRVDLFDTKSRPLGWGQRTPTGRLELFGVDGTRQGEAGMPFQPQRKGERR